MRITFPSRSRIVGALTPLFGLALCLLAITSDAAIKSGLRAADSVLAAAPNAAWIAEGQGKRVVYVFFDANCPSCKTLYQNLRSFLRSHDLQLRWIPVAVVNTTSAGKAAAIIESPDPVAALRHNEEHYDGKSYAGGIEEHIPSAETEAKLLKNERLLNQLEIPVVPSMLFADKYNRATLIQGSLSPVALRKVFAQLPYMSSPVSTADSPELTRPAVFRFTAITALIYLGACGPGSSFVLRSRLSSPRCLRGRRLALWLRPLRLVTTHPRQWPRTTVRSPRIVVEKARPARKRSMKFPMEAVARWRRCAPWRAVRRPRITFNTAPRSRQILS